MQKKWQKAEKKDAKLFGASNQRGSGNQDHYPTDAVSDQFAIETKQTEKGSYSISLKKWQKLVEETAILNQKDGKNRIPILSLHISSHHLVVLDYEDFEVMKDKAWRYLDLY
jgi:hypothetical protein